MKHGTASTIEAEPARLAAAVEPLPRKLLLGGDHRPSRIPEFPTRSRFHAVAARVREIELSVVIPCLNEAQAIGKRVRQALEVLREAAWRGKSLLRIMVRPTGLPRLPRQKALGWCGWREGYGNAIMGGIAEARGEYVLMADADESHDLTHIPHFLAELRTGQDFVMGNRFRGGIAKGAMPFLHRYLGNPVLTGLGKLFFKSRCGDFHCGMRAFRRECYGRMDLRSTGMEFASEMVVKATLLRMKISEIPTTQLPDGRGRPPHLRTWQDGWRHLRFLLMYSPRWLFLYPGVFLMLLGLAGCAWLLPGPQFFHSIEFDVHTLLYALCFCASGLSTCCLCRLHKNLCHLRGFAA